VNFLRPHRYQRIENIKRLILLDHDHVFPKEILLLLYVHPKNFHSLIKYVKLLNFILFSFYIFIRHTFIIFKASGESMRTQ